MDRLTGSGRVDRLRRGFARFLAADPLSISRCLSGLFALAIFHLIGLVIQIVQVIWKIVWFLRLLSDRDGLGLHGLAGLQLLRGTFDAVFVKFRRLQTGIPVDQDDNVMLHLHVPNLVALVVQQIIGHLLGGGIGQTAVPTLGHLLLQLAKEMNGGGLDGTNGSQPFAAGTFQTTGFVEGGFHPLPGEFQQPERGNFANLNLGAVQFEGLFELFFNLQVVLFVLHVDKIDDDQAAQVTQTQLSANLLRRLEIGLEGCTFHIPFPRGATRIDVNGDHGLRGIDHQ